MPKQSILFSIFFIFNLYQQPDHEFVLDLEKMINKYLSDKFEPSDAKKITDAFTLHPVYASLHPIAKLDMARHQLFVASSAEGGIIEKLLSEENSKILKCIKLEDGLVFIMMTLEQVVEDINIISLSLHTIPHKKGREVIETKTNLPELATDIKIALNYLENRNKLEKNSLLEDKEMPIKKQKTFN